ncbi:MAG: putative cytochrome c oxidase assembly protein, partial [uncultured bacterium]
MRHMSFAQKKLSLLALATCLLALIVILLGAYTRLTNAGLSCPDWPHCYGYLTAPHTSSQIQAATKAYPGTPVETTKAWTEMVHRYAAGGEGLLILALVILIGWRKPVSLVLIALLSTQILLGMLTVTRQLNPLIVLS